MNLSGDNGTLPFIVLSQAVFGRGQSSSGRPFDTHRPILQLLTLFLLLHLASTT